MKKTKSRHEHDIVFPSSNDVPHKHRKIHDEDHHHYIRYKENVLPYHDPIVRYYQSNWMSRFYSTIQDIGANYPDYPTLQDINAMKNFILALPHIVPCHTTLCSAYITNHVDRNSDNLDAITGNKEVLYDFLRDFYSDIKQKFGNELYEDTYYHGI